MGRRQVRDGRGSPPDQAPAGGFLGGGAEDGLELAPAGSIEVRGGGGGRVLRVEGYVGPEFSVNFLMLVP